MFPLTPSGLGAAAGQALEQFRDFAEPTHAHAHLDLMLGPWLRTYGIGSDERTRIDDAPGFEGRFGPELDDTWNDGQWGNQKDPASRAGSALFGVEAGLAKFLAVDAEAVAAWGRAYLVGSVDVGKFRGEIFAKGIFDLPDFKFSHGRLAGDRTFQIGLRIGAQVLAELIGAHYEVGYDTPGIPMADRALPVEITARLDAAVHAFARVWAEGSVGSRSALAIGAKAFAGASATLSGQAELASMIGAHGSVTAWCGTGAEFTAHVEFDARTGKFDADHSAGAAVGVGASYDYGVSVNAGAILASTQLPSRVPGILEAYVERVGDAGRAVLKGELTPGEGAGDVAKATGWALGQVARAVDDSLPR